MYVNLAVCNDLRIKVYLWSNSLAFETIIGVYFGSNAEEAVNRQSLLTVQEICLSGSRTRPSLSGLTRVVLFGEIFIQCAANRLYV